MLFTSLAFLIFAVVIFFTYYLVPKKGQWIVLLVGSGVFYFWAGWQYFLFLVGTITITYLLGLWLGFIGNKEETGIEALKTATPKEGEVLPTKKEIRKKYTRYKWWVSCLGVVVGIGLLFTLKYLNFFGSIFNSIFNKGETFNPINFIVPVGLSFYIFSSIGYLIDVNRGVHPPEKNIFKYALFVSFFPVVLQGPICQYSEISSELYSGHALEMDNVSNGLRRVVLGFLKKIVIADLIGIAASRLFNNYQDYHGMILLVAAIMYAIQLYADFSGYMDIALGFSEMLGIKLPENFDIPYFSHSISEFWRRWHITLGAWFRNYMYFSLLRSNWLTKIKKAIAKKNKKFADAFVTIIALLLVWVSIGLWHGASFNFLIYGCFHGLFVILDVALSGVYERLRKLFHINSDSLGWKSFQIVRTFYLVTISFFLFRSAKLDQAGYMFVESLKVWDWNQLFSGSFISLGIDWYMYIVVVGAILICYFANSLFRNSNSQYLMKYNLREKLPRVVQYAFFVLIVWGIISVYIYENSLDNVSSAFIYFDF